mgnify:CR=1 FL=1
MAVLRLRGPVFCYVWWWNKTLSNLSRKLSLFAVWTSFEENFKFLFRMRNQNNAIESSFYIYISIYAQNLSYFIKGKDDSFIDFNVWKEKTHPLTSKRPFYKCLYTSETRLKSKRWNITRVEWICINSPSWNARNSLSVPLFLNASYIAQ